jgi:hypothetical protein
MVLVLTRKLKKAGAVTKRGISLITVPCWWDASQERFISLSFFSPSYRFSLNRFSGSLNSYKKKNQYKKRNVKRSYIKKRKQKQKQKSEIETNFHPCFKISRYVLHFPIFVSTLHFFFLPPSLHPPFSPLPPRLFLL